MARRVDPVSTPEDYEKILEAFDDFGRPPPTPSRRLSTGSNAHSAHSEHGGSTRGRSKDNNGSKGHSNSNNSSSRIHARRNSPNTGGSNRSSSRNRAVLDTSTGSHRSSAGDKGRHKSRRSETSISTSTDDDDEALTMLDSSPASAACGDSSTLLDASQSSRGERGLQGVDYKVRNRALIHENRRLQELVDEYEKRLKNGNDPFSGPSQPSRTLSKASHHSTDGDAEDALADENNDESVSRLKSKIKALKSKRKQEKLSLLQAQKSVDTHSVEIEGLQRELNRTFTQLEDSQKGRQEDKQLIHSLQKHLEARQFNTHGSSSSSADAIKADLAKRDQELEVTLELLQSKVERIIQLEYDVEKAKEKLNKSERRMEELVKKNGSNNNNNNNNFSSMELIDAEAEVKSLRRQNMMLKLVVEELQEARKRRSDSDIDIDSVFLKLPPEIQEEIPRSVGLGVLTFDGTADDASVITENLASFLGGASMPRADPDHPLRRENAS